MRALLSKRVGGPETLVVENLPDPAPGEGEVLLLVKGCGVNFPDSLIIEDRYQFKPQRPFAPGGEVAGIVEKVGPSVKNLRTGDHVIGWCSWGGMAEKLVIDEKRCIPIPSDMPFDEASAFVLTYGTSYYALKNRGRLKAGETVLILGAAGGVGLAAVELSKAMGARVIAAVSAHDKLTLTKQRGADDGIIYPRGTFDKEGVKSLSDLFKKACGPDGVDVIYDGVGGDYAEAALRAIAWDGRFLVVGFPAGIPKIPLNLPLLKSCQIVGVFWAAWTEREPKEFEASVRELLAFYKAGAIKPFISERFPLEKGADAIAWLAGRKAMGKIIVTMN
jgi:NADPH:quinone reductase